MPDEIKTADIIAGLTAQNQLLAAEIAELNHQLAWFKRQLFGAKSEKADPVRRRFPAAARIRGGSAIRSASCANGKNPRTQGKGEVGIPGTKFHRICRARKWSSTCRKRDREGMELIGYEISERLARRETQFFVKVIKRAKYADKSDPLRGVLTAPAAVYRPVFAGKR